MAAWGAPAATLRFGRRNTRVHRAQLRMEHLADEQSSTVHDEWSAPEVSLLAAFARGALPGSAPGRAPGVTT